MYSVDNKEEKIFSIFLPFSPLNSSLLLSSLHSHRSSFIVTHRLRLRLRLQFLHTLSSEDRAAHKFLLYIFIYIIIFHPSPHPPPCACMFCHRHRNRHHFFVRNMLTLPPGFVDLYRGICRLYRGICWPKKNILFPKIRPPFACKKYFSQARNPHSQWVRETRPHLHR